MNEKTIGGEDWNPKLCRQCKEWQTGGHCKIWKRHCYGSSNPCGYFIADERTDQERRDGIEAPKKKSVL